MRFTLKNVSPRGTGYYVRDGWKQTIALPLAHVVGDEAPSTIEVRMKDNAFADKPEPVRVTGMAKALSELPAADRARIRAAGRAAEKVALDALEAASDGGADNAPVDASL